MPTTSSNDSSATTGVQCSPKEMYFKSLGQSERQRSTLTLQNPTSQRYAFKVKTTSPKSYVVKPSVGFLEPESSFKISIIKQRNPKPTVSDKFLIEVMATTERSTNPSDAKVGGANNKAIRLIKVPVHLEVEASSSAENSEAANKAPVTPQALELQPEEPFTPTPPAAPTKSPSRMSPSTNEEIRPTTAARDGLVCMNNDLTFRYNAGASVISSIRLYNPTEDRYAFKVRNTFPKGFKVKPPQGFLKPRTAIDVEVILLNSRGVDFSFAKFLIQSFVVDFTDEVITDAMYHKAKLYKAVRETELDVKLVGFDELPESGSSAIGDQEKSAAAAYEIRYLRKQLIHMESELNALKQQMKRQNSAPAHSHHDSSVGGATVDCVGWMTNKPFFRFRRSRRPNKRT